MEKASECAVMASASRNGAAFSGVTFVRFAGTASRARAGRETTGNPCVPGAYCVPALGWQPDWQP